MPRRASLAPAEPRWASINEASAYSNIPKRTLRDWIRTGRLPGYRIGPRQIQVDLNDIDAMRRRIPAARAAR